MAVNWDKKKHGLRWGIGCGFFYFIYHAFLRGTMFNGRNELWEDISLSAISIALPILAVLIFYWPQQKAEARTTDEENA